MVLDFGLTKASTVAHSISSTKLSSLKHKRRAEKKRQASSKDYCASSSSDDDESSSYSDCDSSDEELYKELDAFRHSHHKTMATLQRIHSLEDVLDFEKVEEELAAGGDGNPVKLAADLEAELCDPSNPAAILIDVGDDVVNDEDSLESDDFLDALDEVHTRFLLNVPPEELSTSERIFFQLEQAWWYYEDLICDKLEQDFGVCNLPRFANMKPFSKRLFSFSPLLRDLDFEKLWKDFAVYKRKISTYGCILLNEACTHVVLCKLYKSNTWTFPSGKINQNEKGIDAAARETYEETGFDPNCTKEGGLTHQWMLSGDRDKITWEAPLQDSNALSFVEQPSGKRRTCYVCKGVPEDFPFHPVCRKEVDSIEWIDIHEIKEYKSFAVLPFMGKLKSWIQRQKNTKRSKSNRKQQKSRPRAKSSQRDKSSGKQQRDKSSSRQRGKKKDKQTLVDAGLISSMGDPTRWTADEMFDANSKLQGGRTIEYDGNPHAFAEQGFGIDDEAKGQKRVDPHSFRVVGGAFMNSEYGDQLATSAGPSKYQPLVRDNDKDQGELQPFFSETGATPWGDVVEEAKSDDGVVDEDENDASSQELLQMLKNDLNIGSKPKKKASRPQKQPQPVSGNYDYDDPQNNSELMIFATDKEITAKRQREHEQQKESKKYQEQLVDQYEKDMAFVNNWVANLPNPINFEISNVDEILHRHFGPPKHNHTGRHSSLAVQEKKNHHHRLME